MKDNAAGLLVLAVVILSYFNSLSSGFVFDDYGLVVDNTRLGGWESIPVIFTSGYWEDGGGLYRPLTILSFMVEHALTGFRPFLYHMDNVLLHLGCTLLVYVISKRVIGGQRPALFAALLFAAHPVHTEAVAWVSGRAELLSAFFMLLAFQLYAMKPPSPLRLGLSCLAFFTALLAKESALVLPVLLALYILLFAEAEPLKSRIRRVAGLYPYAAVFLVYMLIRFAVLGVVGPAGEDVTLGEFSAYQRFLVMCEALYYYLRLVFFPVGLSEDYMFLPAGSVFHYKVTIPIAVTAMAVAVSARYAKSHAWALFGVLWFFIALLPVSNIIPIGLIMSERAMYLPSVGVCMLLGAGFSAAYPAGHASRHARFAGYIVIVLTAVVIGLFAAGSYARNPVWGDQERFSLRLIKMWERRIALMPGHAPYYSALADEYIRRGDYGPRAEEAARTAVMLDDKAYRAHYSLAMVYTDRGLLDDALREVEASLKLRESADAYNLAGAILYMLGRYSESDAMSANAVRMRPRSALFRVNRGYTRLNMGDPDTAFGLFEEALALEPDNVDALVGQGEILEGRKQYAPAAKRLERAVRLNTKKADAHYYLGVAYMNTGRPGLARAELEKTVALDPANKGARELLRELGAGTDDNASVTE